MRQTDIITIDTTSVQGAGSFAKAKLPKWGRFRAALNLQDTEAMQYANELLAETVVDWNWTDDENVPMPPPSKDGKVVDDLTVAEVQFLVQAITTQGIDRGN